MAVFTTIRPQSRTPLQQQGRRLQRDQRAPIIEIHWRLLLRRMYMGLRSWVVALRYRFLYRPVTHAGSGTASVRSGRVNWRQLPWLKLGLAMVALYVFTQKNVQFSINMKAPLTTSDHTKTADQLAIAALPMNYQTSSSAPVTNHVLDEGVAAAYIRRFERVARAEMHKYGIPASLKLAQGLLESQAGQGAGVTQDNNHFGAPLAGKNYISAWENWRAHSEWLADRLPCKTLSDKNAATWIKRLPEAGYPDDATYQNQLLQLIEAYELTNYDLAEM